MTTGTPRENSIHLIPGLSAAGYRPFVLAALGLTAAIGIAAVALNIAGGPDSNQGLRQWFTASWICLIGIVLTLILLILLGQRRTELEARAGYTTVDSIDQPHLAFVDPRTGVVLRHAVVFEPAARTNEGAARSIQSERAPADSASREAVGGRVTQKGSHRGTVFFGLAAVAFGASTVFRLLDSELGGPSIFVWLLTLLVFMVAAPLFLLTLAPKFRLGYVYRQSGVLVAANVWAPAGVVVSDRANAERLHSEQWATLAITPNTVDLYTGIFGKYKKYSGLKTGKEVSFVATSVQYLNQTANGLEVRIGGIPPLRLGLSSPLLGAPFLASEKAVSEMLELLRRAIDQPKDVD